MDGAPRDKSAIVAASVAASTLIAHQVMAKATRDALFLSTWGIELLPRMMVAAALISLLSVVVTARLLARFSPARVVPFALVASAALGVAEWIFAGSSPHIAALILYLHLSLFGATTISAFWSLISERFDTRTVKRVVARIASGGTIGGVLGGIFAFAAAERIGVRGTIAVVTALHLAAAVVIGPLARGAARAPVALRDGARSGLEVLREVRYLRDLAWIVALVAALNAILDWSLGAHAARTLGTGATLLSFFALFHMSVGLLTFFAQTIAGRLALERLGAAGSIAVLPTIALLGSLAVLPTPRLFSVAVVRSAAAIAENSIFRAGYELLFTPIPIERKRPTKTLIDVGCDRLGTAFGAAIAIILARSSQAAWLAMISVGIASALVLLVVVRRLHGGYIRALADNLRFGAPRLPEQAMGSTSGLHFEVDRARLLREVAALRRGDLGVSGEFAAPVSWPLEEDHTSSQPLLDDAAALLGADRAAARAVLERPTPIDGRLVPQAIALLGNGGLADEAIDALRRVADAHVGQLVDALLDPATPFDVRRRLPRVLSRSASQRAVDGLVAGLADQRFDVRWACGVALLNLTEQRPQLSVGSEQILSAIRREIETGQRLWDVEPPLDSHEHGADTPFAELVLHDRTSRSLQHVFALLALAFEREPMRLALRALLGSDGDLRSTALEYLENVLPDDLREKLWPYIGDYRTPSAPRRRPPQKVLEDLLRSGAIQLGPRKPS